MADKTLWPVVLLSFSLSVLTACQPQPGRVDLQSDEKLIISKSTWDYYQQYLQTVDGGNRGAFVVSDDGYYATYSYCPVVAGCFRDINYSAEALKNCASEGYKCVVFAKNDDIVVDYEVTE